VDNPVRLVRPESRYPENPISELSSVGTG
jgi:hypothetical protein